METSSENEGEAAPQAGAEGDQSRAAGFHRQRSPNLPGSVTVGIVSALLFLFAALSFTAILGKSATYDETLHSVGGMVHRYRNDYRINPEDPALFGWWASLPHGPDAVPLNTPDAEPYFSAATSTIARQWYYVVECLYANGAEAADRFLNTSRFMFVLLGMALGALIARWAYELAGGWAAVAAATLYCLDANFLGHSALVKNDVPLALLMCGLAYTLWRFGRSGGWYWLVTAAAVCGLAVNIKFSGVLFGPMLVMLLIGRAALNLPWTILGVRLQSQWSRAGVSVIGAILSIAAVWGLTWAVYGFRYNATADGQPLSTHNFVITSISNTVQAEAAKGTRPGMTVDDLASIVNGRLQKDYIPMPVKADLWLQDHHVLPEGWLFGFLYTYATTLLRSAFLVGNVRVIGWWYYFPAAMLFKTPTATLIAMLAAPIILLIVWSKSPRKTEPNQARLERRWTLIALVLAPVIYFAAALTTNLNLGLRHILPVYSFIFVAVGGSFAYLLQRWRLPTFACGAALALLLLVETVSAYPNYLAFFNYPSGGARGGLRLLGDSNLDWGQDLPKLAAWQKQHPGVSLFCAYFGTAKPSAYGINCVNLPGGYPFEPIGNVTGPGVIALSATNVQRIYWPPQFVEAYVHVLDPQTAAKLQSIIPGEQRNDAFAADLRGIEPTEVLNGTIYLYEIPPRK